MSLDETHYGSLLSKEELRGKFGLINYAIFVCMLLVSAFIGVFYWWRGQKNTEEFLLASRSMSTVPMTLSLVASFMSAITLLGVPAEIYTAGTQFLMSLIVYPLIMEIVIRFVFLLFFCTMDRFCMSIEVSFSCSLVFTVFARKLDTLMDSFDMTDKTVLLSSLVITVFT